MLHRVHAPTSRPELVWPTVLLALAAMVGLLVPLAPLAVLVGAPAAMVIAWLVASPGRARRVFVRGLAVLLVGYMFLDKGFAYTGVAPVYVGEVVLALALVAFLRELAGAKFTVLHALLVAFMVWGAVRTVPYVPVYGVVALRDGATWGYAAFALAVSVCLRPDDIPRVVRGYRRLIPLFLLWVPVVMLVMTHFAGSIPLIPGTGIPLLEVKDGDLAAMTAGVAAFILVGLYARCGAAAAVVEPLLWLVWLIGAAILVALSRGSMLAIASASLVLLFVRSSVRLLRAASVALLLLLVLVIANPTVNLGVARKVSVDQFASNFSSILGNTNDPNLASSKEWRLAWWDTIVGYTFDGPYFWVGKGYGINLADADGYQVASDDSLRAPHSSHFDFLARSGVPGLALWIALQLAFGIQLIRAAVKARVSCLQVWLALYAWVFAMWAAALITMSFDVYLEGPQGGIWFWSVFGFGMALMALAPNHAAEASRSAGTSSHALETWASIA